MDEYCGGIATQYMTNEPMLDRGLELLGMLHEDLDCIGAEDLHQLQRTWELHHRVWASESVTHHTKFREETRWPGYYYRGDHPKLDDGDWHVFTLGGTTPTRRTGRWRKRRCITSSTTDLDRQSRVGRWRDLPGKSLNGPGRRCAMRP